MGEKAGEVFMGDEKVERRGNWGTREGDRTSLEDIESCVSRRKHSSAIHVNFEYVCYHCTNFLNLFSVLGKCHIDLLDGSSEVRGKSATRTRSRVSLFLSWNLIDHNIGSAVERHSDANSANWEAFEH